MHDPLLKKGDLVLIYEVGFDDAPQVGVVVADQGPRHDLVNVQEIGDDYDSIFWGIEYLKAAVWTFVGPVPRRKKCSSTAR